MISIGIMQGRLVVPYEGRFQACPITCWRDEFLAAQRIGLNCIEWIFDGFSAEQNPLGSDEGIAEIEAVVQETGVQVQSINADYYMVNRLVGRDGVSNQDAVDHLKWLIGRSEKIGAKYIVLAFVDAAALNSPPEWAGLVEVLKQVASAAEKAGVRIDMETALPPRLTAELFSRVGSSAIGFTFDIGDRAALGIAPDEDLFHLMPWMGSVHVKDRPLGGGTVPVGQGASDLGACFKGLAVGGFKGPLILQVARGDDGGEEAWIKDHFERVQGLAQQHFVTG